MILIVIGWIIFRNTNIDNLLLSIETMFIYKPSDIEGFFYLYSGTASSFLYFIPAIIFSFPVFDFYKDRKNNIIVNGILLVLFMMCITFLISSSYNPFI